MSTVEVTNDNTGSTSPLPDVTDDSCGLQFDIAALTTDASTKSGTGNLCFEVKPETLPDLKDEPGDLCGLQLTEVVPLSTDDDNIQNSCFEVKPEILPALKDEPGDLCGLQFTEVVPLTADDDNIRNLCFEVKPEISTALKDKPDDLCGLQFTEVVPLSTDDDFIENLCFEVKPEIVPPVKQEADDLHGFQNFTGTVPLSTDVSCRTFSTLKTVADKYLSIPATSTSSTAECDSGNMCFQVEPEMLPAVKQERDDLQVCCS